MKRIVNHIFAAFAAIAALASCTQKEQMTEGGAAIRFSASVGTFGTKATDTGFERGDLIGISALDPVGVSNVKATVSADGTIEPSTVIRWGESQGVDDITRFSAYYPYTDGLAPERDFTFSVQTDQSTHAGYTASDLMMADTWASPAEDHVKLNFTHQLSQLCMTVKAVDGFAEVTGVTVGNVSIVAVGRQAMESSGTGMGDVNINWRYISAEWNPDRYEQIKACPVTDSDGNTLWTVILPSGQPEYLSLTVTFADGTEVSYSSPTNWCYLEAGKRTYATVGINETGLTVDVDGDVYDWLDGYYYSFSQPVDWASFSWYVDWYLDGELQGSVPMINEGGDLWWFAAVPVTDTDAMYQIRAEGDGEIYTFGRGGTAYSGDGYYYYQDRGLFFSETGVWSIYFTPNYYGSGRQLGFTFIIDVQVRVGDNTLSMTGDVYDMEDGSRHVILSATGSVSGESEIYVWSEGAGVYFITDASSLESGVRYPFEYVFDAGSIGTWGTSGTAGEEWFTIYMDWTTHEIWIEPCDDPSPGDDDSLLIGEWNGIDDCTSLSYYEDGNGSLFNESDTWTLRMGDEGEILSNRNGEDYQYRYDIFNDGNVLVLFGWEYGDLQVFYRKDAQITWSDDFCGTWWSVYSDDDIDSGYYDIRAAIELDQDGFITFTIAAWGQRYYGTYSWDNGYLQCSFTLFELTDRSADGLAIIDYQTLEANWHEPLDQYEREEAVIDDMSDFRMPFVANGDVAYSYSFGLTLGFNRI